MVPQPYVYGCVSANGLPIRSGYYDVGGRYDLPPRLVSDTLAAIVMSELWVVRSPRSFPRIATAVAISVWAVSSDFARNRLRQLDQSGIVDVELKDAEYLEPVDGDTFRRHMDVVDAR